MADAGGLNDPVGKPENFARILTTLLSGNYSESKSIWLNNSAEN